MKMNAYKDILKNGRGSRNTNKNPVTENSNRIIIKLDSMLIKR
jgi:hypothetical protein